MKKLLSAFTTLSLIVVTPVFAADVQKASNFVVTMPQADNPAPAFTLPGQDGKNVSLSDYHGRWVVLYFYPKDFTSGCSLEAHNFQTDSAKFRADNAAIIGISVDSVDSHKGFCTQQGLDFKLLSDEKHAVSELYGSTMEHDSHILAARNTFLIAPDGTIRKIYMQVNPATHSQEVLADLSNMKDKTP